MLTEDQKNKLRDAATERGVDADALISEAERQSQSQPTAKPGTGKPADAASVKADKPLYMYHLPFVTVNEVRTIWLGLGPIAGGDEYAAKFAAAQTAGSTAPPSSGSDPNAA